MIKLLFVCHGNICRSPMGEFYMKDLVQKKGVADRFIIASAATSTEELGNPVYPPARKKLLEHDIDPSGKTARRLTRDDYDEYDYIIGMDDENIYNMNRLFHNDPDHKVHMLLEYAGRPKESVADPWFTRDFEATWQDVKSGCDGLFAFLTDQGEI